jgi:pentatricopeptide repeat protein
MIYISKWKCKGTTTKYCYFTTIIAFMGKSWNVEEALQLAKRMKSVGCKFDTVFLQFLDSYNIKNWLNCQPHFKVSSSGYLFILCSNCHSYLKCIYIIIIKFYFFIVFFYKKTRISYEVWQVRDHRFEHQFS